MYVAQDNFVYMYQCFNCTWRNWNDQPIDLIHTSMYVPHVGLLLVCKLPVL